ncbi:hypothetical protein AbraIFM66950_002470 [Aspergillus brasiliensis]|nr:hypothetical protein AbraIFM66950_002470 [Aspergillus brasiliensis]
MPPFPILFYDPKDWTANHLQSLRLERHFNASLDEVIGAGYIPKDGDEEFESLAAEFAEPTKGELKNLCRTACVRYRRNMFLPVFQRLCQMLNSDVFFDASRQALLAFVDITLRHVHLEKPLQTSCIQSISFKVAGVRGELACQGVLSESSMPQSPLGFFSVAKDGDYNFKGQVAQLLLQKAVAYQLKQSRRAYVIFMDGTNLQITMADPDREYLDALFHGHRPDSVLHLYHSEFFNLCNRRRRKEALRVILGLIRRLDADGLTRVLP